MIIHIAKKPPPIGGVTIHVQRLNKILIENGLDSEVFDYSRSINLNLITKILSSNIIHLHVSNKLFRLILTVFFRLLGKKVIITFHGNYNFKKILDKFSLLFCNHAILLNEYSYDNAKKISERKISLVSAFIPPITLHPQTLKANSIKKIESLRQHYNYVFCTNAWDISYDEEGKEIYGGSILVETFSEITDNALIFSDPKGNYQSFLSKKYVSLPPNILFIDYIHDFVEVIQSCDALIRATSTDGDSLSVHEALFLRKDVITTNVVNRPNGCILYSDRSELKNILINFNNLAGKYIQYKYLDTTNEMMKVYSNLSR
ncbi:MAG TPA: hypothetical protein P5239_09415 [Victivallales bacterium]|jgi:glycosyltransferase involved in cell wall biosynthesis|nr:hypothetical protein [Victivallales bacterium]